MVPNFQVSTLKSTHYPRGQTNSPQVASRFFVNNFGNNHCRTKNTSTIVFAMKIRLARYTFCLVEVKLAVDPEVSVGSNLARSWIVLGRLGCITFDLGVRSRRSQRCLSWPSILIWSWVIVEKMSMSHIEPRYNLWRNIKSKIHI